MIGLEELNGEISELEEQEPTYAVLDRLAAMYIIRDKLRAAAQSDSMEPVKLSGSEFLNACSGVNMPSLFSILDEHMDAIKAIHPREYMALIQKINLLHSI